MITSENEQHTMKILNNLTKYKSYKGLVETFVKN